MSTRAFATFVNVSDKAQKNLVEFIHTIGRTRLMHIMTPSYSGVHGSDIRECAHLGRTEVAAVVRILDINFRYPYGSFGRICIPDRLKDAWESFPKLHRLRGDLPVSCVVNPRCNFVSFFRQVRLILSPNIRTASVTGRKMLNPSCTLRCIYPRMRPNISGVHSDAWGLVIIIFSRA